MHFAKWLAKQKRGVRARMIRELGEHSGALDRAQAGRRLSYPNAERLSALTGGQVTVRELCAPSKERR